MHPVVVTDRGFAAVPRASLESLGWTVGTASAPGDARGPADAGVSAARRVSPFFRWDGTVLQLDRRPVSWRRCASAFPLQLLTDFLPRRLPDLYAFDGPPDPARGSGAGRAGGRPTASASRAPPPGRQPAPRLTAPSRVDGPRVLGDERRRACVIIDAGHGGKDPGTIGRGGVREKTVALGDRPVPGRGPGAVPGLEVHLIRDTDTLVPLWDRGQIATRPEGRPPRGLHLHPRQLRSTSAVHPGLRDLLPLRGAHRARAAGGGHRERAPRAWTPARAPRARTWTSSSGS